MSTRKDGIRTVADIKDRCRVDEFTGCWLWAGAKKGTAPRPWIPGVGATSMTMALQLVIHGTKPTPKRMLVPTCHNVQCCNPAHRKWGTRSELFAGIRPTLSPGHRARTTAGKRAASNVCTAKIAAEIRASDEPVPALSARLGIHPTHVYRIRRGESWATSMPASSVFALGQALGGASS